MSHASQKNRRPRPVLPAGRRHHRLHGLPVLLGHRVVAESGIGAVPGRVLAGQPGLGQLCRGVPGTALRTEHPELGRRLGRGRGAVAVPGADGVLCAGAGAVPGTRHAADGGAGRFHVSAGRGAVRHVRTDPLAGALQQPDGPDPVLHDLHPALHGLGADHLHARVAEGAGGGGHRGRRQPVGHHHPRLPAA